jgi:hypothetical protein
MKVFPGRSLPIAAAAVLALALSGPVAVAQGEPPIEPSAFGVGNIGVTTIPWTAFLPWNSDTSFFSTPGEGRFTVGNQPLLATLDRGAVPNGAVINEIRFYVNDGDSEYDVGASFCWEAVDSETGADSGSDCPANGSTSGTPERTVITLNPDSQVLFQQDTNSDGAADTITYYLLVVLPSDSPITSIQTARVLWTRTISNPPAAATFNDVPTGHPFFRYVEALADAGITGGCGGGSYCPNSPLTRGQMAVFLSSALGLNWDYSQIEPNP